MSAVPQHCRWHNGMAEDAILVGAIERGSGPARPVFACPACVKQHRIIPLDEHPEDSNGVPRYRKGHPLFAVGRDALPTTATRSP